MTSPRCSEQTYSTTSPMTNNPGGRCSNSVAICQSTTETSKPRFAAVRGFAAKITKSKKNKNKNKNKPKIKKKKSKKKKVKVKGKKTKRFPFSSKNKTKTNKKKKSIDQNHSTTLSSKFSNASNASSNPQSTTAPPSISDSISNKEITEDEQKQLNNSPSQTIQSKGYKIKNKIADTLQGKIYRCNIIKRNPEINYLNDDNICVIKLTSKELYNRGITIMENGSFKAIQEDILKEKELLRDLTLNGAPASMVRYIDFFEDSEYYYLVLEDGGNDLFEYVVKCHNLLRKGTLSRKEWRITIKHIFKQIVNLMDWLHNTQNVCHLDISLENMLIKNGNILQNIHSGQITLSRNFQIKFCDFGLSEKFPSKIFKCVKYVGKTRYKSPELWTKNKVFDARQNDIWSLGIALFMMIMGAPPLKYPDYSDQNFKLIINGKVLELIQSWNRAKYMTPQILDLLTRMLTKESKRITLEQIKSHSWVV